MASTRYINHASPIIFAGPYSLQDVKLFLFPVKGDKAKIQATVDGFFKDLLEGSGIYYEVLSGHIALGAAYMNAVSANPEVQKIFGGFPEVDYAAWIPLLKYEDGLPVGFYWFMSFVLVDNPLAIATGREVFGFQKNQGVFDPPSTPAGPVDFSASAWSLQTYGPDSRVKLFPLFQLKNTGRPSMEAALFNGAVKGVEAAVDALEEDWSGLLEQGLCRLVESLSKASTLMEHLTNSFFKLKVPMVFLKQFRSATDPYQACCQSVVETSFTITQLRSVRAMPDRYRFTFAPNATYNLAKDYGLTSEVDIELSVEVDMNFDLPMGTIVYPKSP